MMDPKKTNDGPLREESPQTNDPLEVAENALIDIGNRIDDKRTDIDWQDEVHDLMVSSGVSQTGKEVTNENSKYYGHDMTIREDNTGCRIATVNAANSCPVVRDGKKVIENLIDKVREELIDIMIIHEPGTINPKEAAAMRAAARYREVEAVIRVDGAKKSEGVIVLLGPAWRMVKTYDRAWEVKGKGNSKARLLQLGFESAAKGEVERREQARESGAAPVKDKLALFAVYGYSGQAESKASKSLWRTAERKITRLRNAPQHRLDTIVVAGDFNMCISTALDTDRGCENPEQREPEAGMLKDTLGDLGVIDAFRHIHPKAQAVTRIPGGKKALTDAARRLDYICTNKQITEHPCTRIGIRKEPYDRTDHLPVIMDIPTNCADLASDVHPIWDIHEVKKLQLRDPAAITDEDIAEFSEAWTRTYKEKGAQNPSFEEKGKAITEAMYSAAVGTIAEEITQKYPKRAKTTEHREGWGEKLDAWEKRIRGACNEIKNVKRTRNMDTLNKALEKVKWLWDDIPEGIIIDKLQDLTKEWRTNPEEVKTRLIQQLEEIKKHQKNSEAAEKRERISKAVKKRNEEFNCESDNGKGKGTVWLCSESLGCILVPGIHYKILLVPLSHSHLASSGYSSLPVRGLGPHLYSLFLLLQLLLL